MAFSTPARSFRRIVAPESIHERMRPQRLPHEYFSGLNKNSRPSFYDRYDIPTSPIELTLNLGNPPLSGRVTGAIILSWFPTEPLAINAKHLKIALMTIQSS